MRTSFKTTENNKNYYFIFEQSTDSNIDVIKKEKSPNKIRFKAELQTINDVNGNNRIYSDEVSNEIVRQLSEKINNGGLMMEVDHPMFVSDSSDVLKKRASIVELNNVGLKINEISKVNNKIIGDVETLTSFKGPDVYNLIVEDKVDIGFSLRALGKVIPGANNTLEVQLPIKAITYDLVTQPSHKGARIVEFLPEAFSEYISDESENVLTESEMNGNSCVLKFVQDIINENFLDVIKSRIKFNLI